MTIDELHTHEDLRREWFPVAAHEAFLGNAAVCALPKVTAQAMSDYAWHATQGDQEARRPMQALEVIADCRANAARLLGGEAHDYAIVPNTSVGLSLVANGLDWQPGDNVVFAPDCYPSNAVVWMALKERGVELRPIEKAVPGDITLADVQEKVDARTRLVAIASAHFVSGHRFDVDTVGKWLHGQDVLFCVDAIQTLGAIRTPLDFVDFAPADSHKWLLGPCGAGLFYVSERGRAALKPTLLGWHNVVCPDFMTPDEIQFIEHARRYEAGTPNIIGTLGMNAALKMLLDFGAEAIETAVLGHTRRIREAVRAMGYDLAGPDDEALTGITSFRKGGNDDMAKIHARLTEARITASFRSTRDGRKWIRLSPHFYNSPAEVDRALDIVAG